LGEERRIQIRQHTHIAGKPGSEIVLGCQGGDGGLDHHRG
jgi:hypothetical protein